MAKNRKGGYLGIILIILGFVIFGIYLYWARNYHNIEGQWGGGIWLVAVGVFISGLIMYGVEYDD